jgi:hypothetical protein
MKSWEIYAAQSISQRKLLKGLVLLDRLFGAPIVKRLHKWESENLKQIKIHRTGIFEYEEDEGLFFYNWCSLFVWFFFPIGLYTVPIHRFDHSFSGPVKRSVMRFYMKCIKRHLYVHGGNLYLAKNPSLTPRIDSLCREFPDAKIIYLLRNPVDTVSSMMGWFSFAWNYFADPLEKYPYKELLLEMVRHWYRYPMERLRQEPEGRYMIIRYEDLTGRLDEVVFEMYRKFRIPLSTKFKEIVEEAAHHSRIYSSPHHHALDKAGLDENKIEKEFSDLL